MKLHIVISNGARTKLSELAEQMDARKTGSVRKSIDAYEEAINMLASFPFAHRVQKQEWRIIPLKPYAYVLYIPTLYILAGSFTRKHHNERSSGSYSVSTPPVNSLPSSGLFFERLFDLAYVHFACVSNTTKLPFWPSSIFG